MKIMSPVINCLIIVQIEAEDFVTNKERAGSIWTKDKHLAKWVYGIIISLKNQI